MHTLLIILAGALLVNADNLNRWAHSFAITKSNIILLNGLNSTLNDVTNSFVPLDNTASLLSMQSTVNGYIGYIGQSCIFDGMDSVICIGGVKSNQDLDSLPTNRDTYSSNVWTLTVSTNIVSQSPIALAISQHTTFYMNGKIFIYGMTMFDSTNDMWTYDPLTRILLPIQVANQKPSTRRGHCGAIIDKDRFLVSFGKSVSGLESDTWIFNTAKLSWSPLKFTNQPTSRAWATCSIANNQLFVYGGSTTTFSSPINEFLIYDFVTMQSKSLQNIPIEPKIGHIGFSIDKYVVVQGGRSLMGVPSPKFYAFDYAGGQWVTMPNIATTLNSNYVTIEIGGVESNRQDYFMIGMIVAAVLLLTAITGFICYKKWNQKSWKPKSLLLPMTLKKIETENKNPILIQNAKSEKFVKGNSIICISGYTPIESTDMKLCMGDSLVFDRYVDQEFAYGFNKTTKRSGVFPIKCTILSDIQSKLINHSLMLKKEAASNFRAPSSLPKSIVSLKQKSMVTKINTLGAPNTIITDGSLLKTRRKSKADYSILTPESSRTFESPNSSSKIQTFHTSSCTTDFTQIYVAIGHFDRSLSDELAVALGDTIKVSKIYDDGWAEGMNTLSNECGTFPLDCVRKMDASLTGFDSEHSSSESGNIKDRTAESSSSMRNKKISHVTTKKSAMHVETSKLYRVDFVFIPHLDDEVGLQIGNQVIVK